MSRLLLGIVTIFVCGGVGAGQSCKSFAPTLAQQQLLSRYHLLITAQGLILDERLIPNCEVRQRLAAILQYSLGRNLTLEEERFLALHRAEFNRTVRETWLSIGASPAFPEDGSIREEKWLILLDKNINDQTLNDIVSVQITTDGLSDQAAFLLIHRSTAMLTKEVFRIAALDGRGPSEKLLGIAIVSHYDRDTAMALARNMLKIGLTPQEKHVLGLIDERLSAGDVVTWNDLEPIVNPD
jgi:hypothetical protein